MRLCSPPAQEGCYQAEFYVNPHEAGTLQIFFRRLEDGVTLRTFTIPARYSDKENELFRHDLPGSQSDWERAHNKLNNIFGKNTPLFVLLEDKGGQYIGVAVELWFAPDDTTHPRRLLLRRCYNVQPYSANLKADISVPSPKKKNEPEKKEDKRRDQNRQTTPPCTPCAPISASCCPALCHDPPLHAHAGAGMMLSHLCWTPSFPT